MLRLFSLIILFASRWNCYGQIKFFINPHVTFKTAFAFVDPASLNNNEKNIFENQFVYMPYAVTHSARFIKHPTFNYGISVGASYKNDTRRIHFSIYRDVANFRIMSYFRPYYDDINAGFGLSYYGVKIHRLTLNYSHKLSKNNSFLQTWLSFGIGSFINTNGFTGTFPVDWGMWVAPNALLGKTYLQPFDERRLNGCIKLGFENDLFLKNKYLFSLNAYYTQGFGIISRVEYVHEYVIDNQSVISRPGLMSRGSGFYFEISRRFKVYSLDKKKN